MSSLNIDIPAEALNGCIAIGNFDGVHRGHAAMLQQLCLLAGKRAAPAVAVTFDPHPIAVLRPEFTPPVLTTVHERIRLLKNAGADHVVVLPVNDTLLSMTPEEFFIDVVLGRFAARGIVEGPNFHFGRDRLGEVQLLQELCRRYHLECRICSPVSFREEMISSSRVRELLCSRALAQAVELLGHPHRISGVVRQGAGRGRGIGFPTANLTEIPVLLPAHGVYAGATEIQGKSYAVAVSIGPNPTFGEHREKLECHIVDFHGDLYGSELSVDLVSEIRPLQSFGSVVQLKEQIRRDIAECVSLTRFQNGSPCRRNPE